MRKKQVIKKQVDELTEPIQRRHKHVDTSKAEQGFRNRMLMGVIAEALVDIRDVLESIDKKMNVISRETERPADQV